ncbi:MAG: gliding motility-associated C-terminal domain-containing protein [Flavobacteriales bacterium]|nr:gliding motility-associated C-terminal domain-containing protein [Flavobacteriales bacterium]
MSNPSEAFVDPLPTATFVSDTVCEGKSTTLFATPGPGAQIASFIWIPEIGGDTIWGYPSPSPVPIYSSAGTFTTTLIIVDINTCQNTVTNQVVVNPNPIAEFTMTPDSTNMLNPFINFTDLSDPPLLDSLIAWKWDFDDGSGSGIQHPTHEYGDSGTYEIELLVTNEFFCVDSIRHLVEIAPEYIIHFPNSFTPNGDTYNDVFQPLGVGINYDFEMYIYNRWGDAIFESFNSDGSWDGTANKTNNQVQEGVYVYVVYFRDHLGQQHEYVGHVTLIR